MAKEKRKNGAYQNRALALIIGTVLAYAIAWGGSTTLLSWLFRLTQLTMKQTHAISFTISSLFIAMAQVQLVERLLNRSMRRWMLYTFAGILLTLPLYRNDPEWPSYATIFLMPLLPIALMQTVWFWRRSPFAWLWMMAVQIGWVASFAFSSLYQGPSNTSAAHLWMSLPYGLIQGLAMYTLWTQPKENEKAKNEFATGEGEDDARAQRLQEDEDSETSQDDLPDRAVKKKAW